MRVIFNVPLPRKKDDLDAFDTGVQAANETGAVVLHAALTPRRYEQFDNFGAFRQSFEQNQLSVSLAEPVLRKHRIRLAIENHKGWRAAEQAAWLKRLGSEYVGVCFDFGNNLALYQGWTMGEQFLSTEKDGSPKQCEPANIGRILNRYAFGSEAPGIDAQRRT